MRIQSLTVLGAMLVAAGAAAQNAAAPDKPQTGVLFENVRVFDGTSGGLSAPSNVLVVGNVIQSISTAPIAAPAGAAVTRIAGGGRTLMPGLIDNHVHVAFSASSQPDLLDPKTSLEVIQARATEEAKQMLLRGFTAVRDLGGPMLEARPKIDKGELPGPRIYPSGAMISQTSGHGDFRLLNERSRRFGGEISRGELLGGAFIADGRDEVLTATRENLRAGASQIKVMAGGGAASAYDPLDVAQYTLDEMKAAVEAAHDWSTYVAVHAYTTKAVRRAVEAGVKCIDHGQLLDEETVKLLAEKGVSAQPAGPRPCPADGARRDPGQEAVGHRRHRQRVRVGAEVQGQARVGHRLPVRPGQQQEPDRRHPQAEAVDAARAGPEARHPRQRPAPGAVRPAQPLPGEARRRRAGRPRGSPAGRRRSDREPGAPSGPGQELRRDREGRPGVQEHAALDQPPAPARLEARSVVRARIAAGGG
jgi:imidazolonepropionase-like amidohydrolase